MTFFNRDEIITQAVDTSSVTTTLTPESVCLILAASGVLEDRTLWDDMTDSEWDEISAYVARLVGEIL